MRTFYAGSHWFWVISRILFVALFVISIAQLGAEGGLRGADARLVNTVIAVGTLVIAVLAILEMARAKKPVWLRIIGGVFMSLLGLGLLSLFFFAQVRSGLEIVLALFVLWILLAGLRNLIMP
ncbi:MAG: hypothetical protein JST66_10360 [Bacteroidetes bacterium]|nr:hypothetical protein [Bacteroidota bacterium]